LVAAEMVAQLALHLRESEAVAAVAARQFVYILRHLYPAHSHIQSAAPVLVLLLEFHPLLHLLQLLPPLEVVAVLLDKYQVELLLAVQAVAVQVGKQILLEVVVLLVIILINLLQRLL
jgi:hypothetical protein